MPKERNMRVTGKRRAFEVGHFVLPIMVRVENLAKGAAEEDAAQATSPASPKNKKPRSSHTNPSNEVDDTVQELNSAISTAASDDQEAA